MKCINYFYHTDIRGSVTNIVGTKENAIYLAQGYNYDNFGKEEALKSESSFKNDVTFTGAVSDSMTGLYYMNARHYDPNTGRFLQQDTYKGSAAVPWTQHLYAYTGNNPVNMVDPTGHSASMYDQYPDPSYSGIYVPPSTKENPYNQKNCKPAGNKKTVLRNDASNQYVEPGMGGAYGTPLPTVYSEDRMSYLPPDGSVEQYKGAPTFRSMDEAAAAWGAIYAPLSSEIEYGAMIFEIKNMHTGETRYGYGPTYPGNSSNVVGGFIGGYAEGAVWSTWSTFSESGWYFRMVAFTHTHPDPGEGWTNDFPSDTDVWLLNLPGMHEVYLFPNKVNHSKGRPSMIKISDTDSWQPYKDGYFPK